MNSFIEDVSPQQLEAARAGYLALTKREIEILQHLIRGETAAESAQQLSISRRTAELHRGHVLEKLGAKSALQVVRLVALLEKSGALALLCVMGLALHGVDGFLVEH